MMSTERLKAEANPWYRQAEDDLEAAEVLIEFGKPAQAAFLCQQAGEMALKALWFALNLDPWGYSLARLVKQLPTPEVSRFEGLLPSAQALDKLYIPTRYPNALAELAPAEAYTHEEALQAVGYAPAILDAVAERCCPSTS